MTRRHGSANLRLPIRLAATLMLLILPCALFADDQADSETAHKGSTNNPKNLDLEMRWWSVDGGGGISQRDETHLIAAVGQPEYGHSSAGGWTLKAGLWSEVRSVDPIFNDGFETGTTEAWSQIVESNKKSIQKPESRSERGK